MDNTKGAVGDYAVPYRRIGRTSRPKPRTAVLSLTVTGASDTALRLVGSVGDCGWITGKARNNRSGKGVDTKYGAGSEEFVAP